MKLEREATRRAAAAIGIMATAGFALWFASWRGTDHLSIWPLDFIRTLATSAPSAVVWIAAAAGVGWPLRRWLLRAQQGKGIVQLGLGVAAMLALDAALGTAGLLQWGRGLVAWAILLPGWILLMAQLILMQCRSGRAHLCVPLPHPLVWCAAPAIAALLVAACSAPGWLWESEFGGYDALSYHLQLPKEWMALGAIRPLEHNVYSYLPGYVEAAFYHLALLRGDAIHSAYAAQLLHAFIAIAAACAIGRLVQALVANEPAGAIAAVAALGTPWTVVTGSLAYNELFIVLFLACSAMIALDQSYCARRRGFAIGLLAGAAVGAKMTAAGFVVLPLGAMFLVTLPLRQCLVIASLAGVSCAAALLPYLARNGLATGNPVFPFATDVFGLAHWTAEQAETWKRGHMPAAGFVDRVAALWNELLRYGLGPAPSEATGEPWKPQWSILVWLGLGGAMASILFQSSPMRRAALGLVAMFAVQMVYWLAYTHLQSRFMISAVAPLCALAVMGGFLVAQRIPNSWRSLSLCTLPLIATLWASQPAAIFFTENDNAPAARLGLIELMTGELHASQLQRAATDEQRRGLLATASPALYLNFLLPDDSRTLLLGDATPFYCTGSHAYQTTWDRGPMSAAVRAGATPQRVIAFLQSRGFSHVLVDLGMLSRWEQSKWNDPLITAEEMLRVLASAAHMVREWNQGAVRLYELAPAR